jgi:hypothetical protein
VVSVLDGITEAAGKMGGKDGVRVVYSQGTTDLNTTSPHGIADAAKLAKSASFTVISVGTGSNVEKEGKDRTMLGLPGVQQDLLEAVSAAVRDGGGKLVVVVVSAQCAFSNRILHSRMPLDPTHVRFKRTCV